LTKCNKVKVKHRWYPGDRARTEIDREIEKHVTLLDFYRRNRKGRKKCVHAIQGKTEKLPFFPEHGKGVSQACTVIMLGDTEKKVMEATEASAREESTET
jgi:ribosomal protein S2